MQWTELLVTCPSCGDQNQVVLPTDRYELVCRRCGGRFEDIQLTPICGFVYVLSNPRMPRLLKIGYTERAVEERAAEVSSGTGIPEPFVVEAYFASPNPSLDEYTVHQSLKEYRLANKEFFELDLDQCLQVLYRVVRRKPCFLRGGLTFETPEERQRRVTEEKRREEEKARQMAGKIQIVCKACHKSYTLPLRASKLTACPSCQSFEIERQY